MALIGKIRKNMWFVFVLLGMALIAFIMMDSTGKGNGGPSGTTAVKINGEKVDIQQFNRLESIESSTSGLSGNALRSKVFDDLLTKTIVDKEAEALGLGVPEEEMQNVLFGFNPSPVIQQWFRNPQTNQVNFQELQKVKQAIESGEVNPNFLQLWNEKSKQAASYKVQEKIADMVSKGMYTPSWMGEEIAKSANVSANFDYVQVPFSKIADSDITLADSDYRAYMDANKADFFSKEEGRVVEYVTFDIIATQKDSLDTKAKMAKKTEDFRTSPNDSLFAITNNGIYQNFYYKADDIPEVFRDTIQGMTVGNVAGPFLNSRFYSAIKLIDKQIIPDSIKAQHILRSASAETPGSMDAAEKYIDSLQTAFESGIDFDSLAINNSQDPGSAPKGGDLGYFTQGTMVPAFNDAVFITGKKEGIYKVKTQYGVHLIKVNEVIYTNQDPKYKVALVNDKIIPSEETSVAVTNKAAEFIANNRSLESFRSSAENDPTISIQTSPILKKGDYAFDQFGYNDDSRRIVLWAFNKNTEVGEVSPDFYSFRDTDFGYESKLVIPGLQAKIAKGNARLSDVKNSITPEVTAFKKGQMLATRVNGKDLDAVAAAEGVRKETVSGASLAGSSAQGLGYEPKVIAAILNGQVGTVTEAIIGNNGVYLVKVNNKTQGATGGNNNALLNTTTQKYRNMAKASFFEALKNKAEVQDKRMDFNM